MLGLGSDGQVSGSAKQVYSDNVGLHRSIYGLVLRDQGYSGLVLSRSEITTVASLMQGVPTRCDGHASADHFAFV